MDLEEGEVIDDDDEQEVTNVKTNFFNEPAIFSYVRDLNTRDNPLGGKQLLTWNQLTKKMLFYYDDDVKAFQDEFIDIFSKSTICADMVETSYLKRIFRSIVNGDDKYDVVFLYDDAAVDSDNPFSTIVGLIVVKKWSCYKYPNSYILDIICSSSRSDVRSGGKIVSNGALLLGLYIYTILSSNTQNVGILELANGYKNITGLCLYTKFGFRKDTSLYDKSCFKDLVSTAMVADVRRLDKARLINIVTNKDNGFEKDMLCNIKDKKVQDTAGILLNLKNMFEYYSDIDRIEELTVELNEIFNEPDAPFGEKHQSLRNKYVQLYNGLKEDDKYYLNGGKRRRRSKRRCSKRRCSKRRHTRKN